MVKSIAERVSWMLTGVALYILAMQTAVTEPLCTVSLPWGLVQPDDANATPALDGAKLAARHQMKKVK